MPTYVYKREDGTTFEIEQRITEDALTTCPTTGQPVQRVISGGTGLIFKGSGFYLTDYARKDNNGNGKESSTPASATKTESTSESDSPKAKSTSSETSSDKASSKTD